MMAEDFEKEKGFGAISIVRSVSSFDDSDDARPTTAGIDLEDKVDNPYSWSTGKKIFHLAIPSLMSLVTTLISSAYVAGVQPMMLDLHVSFEVSGVGYVMYILGLGIGAIFWGPVSEVYGRKIVYMVSIPICAVFVMFTGISHNIAGVLLSRLFAGVFGIGAISAAPGTIVDIYCKEQMALPSALVVLTPFLGPALGPVLAAYVIPWKNWRWVCWIEIAMLGAVWLPGFAMHETNATTIRQRHAVKSGLPPPPSPTEGKSASAVVMHYLNITLFVPLKLLVTESVVAWYVNQVDTVLHSFD
jgi:MFS family permease